MIAQEEGKALVTSLRFPELSSSVIRTLDATFLNGVANHPEVRPWLGGDGELDLKGLIANPDNIVGVTTAHGGFIAEHHGSGRYEVHSLFLPEGLGQTAVRAMRDACDYIFSTSDAVELVTKVPESNAAAKGLAQLAGFAALFIASVPWSTDIPTMPTTFHSLSLDAWSMRSRRARAYGVWLHEAMGELAPHVNHSEEEPAHLQVAGAATMMLRAGMPYKAANVYNRWARWTGYPPIRVIREHPTVMDLGEGIIVEVAGDRIEVL